MHEVSSVRLFALTLLTLISGCGNAELALPLDGPVDGGHGDVSVANETGGPILNGDGSAACVRPTCQELGATCGPVTDRKCGGVILCGDCPPGEVCGGGGPSVCGPPSSDVDGGLCVPSTCAVLGANCGPVSDGCGQLLLCGTCDPGFACGVGRVANVCGPVGTGGDGGSCTPRGCAEQGIFCGAAGDGCGDAIDCGSCMSPNTCGGGGTHGVCGAPTCAPRSCSTQDVSCGPAGDGCGNTLSCGSCASPLVCGGGGTPGKCGCTGVCSQIVQCPTGATTTLKGTVYDPKGANPLYHTLVYIPNDPQDPALHSFPAGISCDQCGATAAGNPLVSTYTEPDGTFTLSNVPVGKKVSLVIQLGRWRRIFDIDIDNPCQANTIADKTLRMPSQQSEGNIPLMAMVTGNADKMECVLRKMGISDAEFTNPGGGGRVQFFLASGPKQANKAGPGMYIDSNTPRQTALFQTVNGKPALQGYDMAILACQGDAFTQSASDLAALRDYANGGGRVFATHYSYTWLANNDDFKNAAKWNRDEGDRTDSTVTGIIDKVSNPKGEAFNQWLRVVQAELPPSGSATVPVIFVRHDADAVVPPTQQWLYRTGAGNYAGTNVPLHFTFNTPVGADSAHQCGRVLFSDFHVSDAHENDTQFPSQCDDNPMNAQEKLLEFMIFDLGSCVQPYVPVCSGRTCQAQGIECGPAGDGCGGAIDCGLCPAGQICGGNGPGKCGAPACTPTTCLSQGVQCGKTGDGCGHLLDCGSCLTGQTCGGGGRAGVCGSTQTCTPTTCAAQGLSCGPAGDGCGNVLDCGPCPIGQTCGAGGHGKCGAPACTPQTCNQQAVECGPAGDGCGNQIDCGNCGTGQTCGAGGPGQCAVPVH